jgi:hypothetical protein
MGGRWRAGDPDNRFCRGLLFHAAAWIVYNLQIRNATARRKTLLQDDPGHHDPQRGCPVRMDYRSHNAAGAGELESLVDRRSFHACARRSRRGARFQPCCDFQKWMRLYKSRCDYTEETATGIKVSRNIVNIVYLPRLTQDQVSEMRSKMSDSCWERFP